MRSVASFLLGLCSVAVVNGAPIAGSDVFEQLPGVPDGWIVIRDPAPTDAMNFRIAVKNPNQADFEQTVLDVSTPGHAKYGRHLDYDGLKALLRPRAEASESVVGWLRRTGIGAIEDDGEWINFNSSVGQAEALLSTKFHWYRNEQSAVERLRTTQYSVPQPLHQHIDMIQPTTRFGQIRPARSHVLNEQTLGEVGAVPVANKGSVKDLSNCQDSITPACIRELYNVGNFSADAGNGNKLGIAGYLEEWAKYSDLATFLQEYSPAEVGSNFSFVGINGGVLDQSDTSHDDIEANLDVQYGIALSSFTPSVYYVTGGRGELVPDLDQPNASANNNEPYLDFLTYMLKLPEQELPQTLTTSYGEDEQSVPESYSRTVCNMFAQLGARGVSIIFSSGDTGPGSGCQSNDGSKRTRFQPTFPGACPWVTSVGGTYHVEPEQAISFSSGGFSERFARPAYQEQAVADYLKGLGKTWDGLYNPAGRGFPDVSAQSSNFHYIGKGQEGLVGGTSAAAPTFAGLVALLNSARLTAKQPPLGFLNPWLYAGGRDGLTDITAGTSKGCTSRDIYSGLPAPEVPGAGWAAVPGWDPSTGLGTPDLQKLLALSAKAATGNATLASVATS